MTPERKMSKSNSATSVVSLDTITSFHLIGFKRFWNGNCQSVAMVRMHVTKVICSKKTGTTAKILIKDWLIMFIAVVSPQAGHGVKPTAIYRALDRVI